MSSVSSAPEAGAGFRLRGVGLLGAALVGGRLAQAAAFFVMARYLDPAAMGAVAILTVLYLGMFQLTNLGLDRYVVYARAQDEVDLSATIDTVWTLQVLRGLLVVALVPLLALGLEQLPHFRIGMAHAVGMAAVVLVLSLANPELSRFERAGDFSFSSLARGLSAGAGAMITMVAVTLWPDPWVYVLGQMASAVALVVASFHFGRRVPRLRWEPARLRAVFGYGQHIVIIAVVSFLATQAQTIYVGVLFGAAVLGSYFTWYRLVSLPGELVTQMQDRLLFAKASDQARRQVEPGAAHLLGFALTMTALVPFHLFVWFHGDVLIALLAGPQWVSFWWVGKAFVVLAFLQALIGTLTPFALVLVPELTSRLRSVEAVGGLLLLLLLGQLYGIRGVLVALTTEMSIATVLRVGMLYRYVVTADRLRHAASALSVLAAIVLPLFAWEAMATAWWPNTPAKASAALAAATYLLITAMLLRTGIASHGRLMGYTQ